MGPVQKIFRRLTGHRPDPYVNRPVPPRVEKGVQTLRSLPQSVEGAYG